MWRRGFEPFELTFAKATLRFAWTSAWLWTVWLVGRHVVSMSPFSCRSMPECGEGRLDSGDEWRERK